MKHAHDKQTTDILTGKRPVGRPPSPTAMTGAERQRLRRQRLKEAGLQEVKVALSADVYAALRKYTEYKDDDYSAAVERILRDRLLRKR